MSRLIVVLLGALLFANFAAATESVVAGKLRVRLDAPELMVLGEQYFATVELIAVGGDVQVETWRVTPASLAMNDIPLLSRDVPGFFVLTSGNSIKVSLNISKYVTKTHDFKLTASGNKGNPIAVSVHVPADATLDFMSIPESELSKYRVYMRTNRGEMLHEMWPQLAPNHVRNFLDLSHTDFYDGTTFHRVMAKFMIQGGDPAGNGSGVGPRMVAAEFTKELHLRGVLSMARGDDPNSGSCQFFVMHAAAPGLDGNYSIFGKMLVGYDALDAIATAPGRFITQEGDIRPNEPQIIERAVVVLAK
ncbi:MAG: peptidyl-prolyl cis-trans isomerase B (cyclophilin B) [Planctomycetota bacterium]|jgi:peptidyl-prolyl cis-trans isomerase B (cyclophilin B)